MIYLFIKHLIKSSVQALIYTPIIKAQYYLTVYLYKNEEYFLSKLPTEYWNFVKIFIKFLLFSGNFVIIDSIMLADDVVNQKLDEIEELFEKQKEKNNYKNDPNFLGKFILKLFLSGLILYFFENFFS